MFGTHLGLSTLAYLVFESTGAVSQVDAMMTKSESMHKIECITHVVESITGKSSKHIALVPASR